MDSATRPNAEVPHAQCPQRALWLACCCCCTASLTHRLRSEIFPFDLRAPSLQFIRYCDISVGNRPLTKPRISKRMIVRAGSTRTCGAVALVHRPGKRTPIWSDPDRNSASPHCRSPQPCRSRWSDRATSATPRMRGGLPVASGAFDRPTCVQSEGCGRTIRLVTATE